MGNALLKSRPVPVGRARITGGFWEQWQRVNREVTLPIEYEQCRRTGRLDAWKLEWKEGEPDPPHYFWDSDVAKWIEAAAYSLVHDPDPELEAGVDEVIEWIEAAQQPDGYLNIHFTIVRPDLRWQNLRQLHELYCAGHLMEAAVAYHDATGKRKLLDVLCRYADHIDNTFGPEAEGKTPGYPGHEEIELALIKLYRATGEERYLRLSTFFVDARGTQPHFYDAEMTRLGQDAGGLPSRDRAHAYSQAHLPVREQTTAEGHSVRACYLYAGMADVAAETADEELFAACRAIFENISQRRMYVTGGVGSSRFGERFTFDYDLPNEEAYAETCAAIALVFFAQRMLQIEPDRCYADVMERALYNGVISGLSLDGSKFFYDNLLATHPEVHTFSGQKSPERQEWFGCACCPPNIARLIAGLNGYVYAESGDTVWVHLFAESDATVEVAGATVRLRQCTQYPWDETVRLSVDPSAPLEFTVAVRLPAWCRNPVVRVNGLALDLPPLTDRGYVRLAGTWTPGDVVEIELPMPIERVEAHSSVRHDTGRIALQRGPVVYCLEEVDNGKDLADIRLPREAAFRIVAGPEELGGVPVLAGQGWRRDASAWGDELYRPAGTGLVPCEVRAVPYYVWANRGSGEMIVWVLE